MLSHADLAQIANAIYAGPAWSARIALDLVEDYLPRTGELVVAVRGTDPLNALNWLRDISAAPMWTPGIGFLHEGFASGALGCWADADRKMRREGLVTYTGHSLGAGIALIMAGLHALHRPDQPFRVVAVAPPRTCLALCSRLSWLLKRGAVAPVAYARAGDLVPHLPLAPLYRHPVAPTPIGALIPDPLKAHEAKGYAATLKALGV